MQVVPTRSTQYLLPRIVSITVYSFKIIGLAPISLCHQAKPLSTNSQDGPGSVFVHSKTESVYNLMLLFVLLIIAAISIENLSSINYTNKSSVTQITDPVLFILLYCTCYFIIVHWIARRKTATVILNRLLSVDYLLSGQNEQVSGKWSRISIASRIAFDVFLWITHVGSGAIWLDSVLTIVGYIPSFIIYFFIVQYSIVLKTVTIEFENLNKKLSNLQAFPNCLSSNIRLAALKSLHGIRTALSEITLDIADFFSFSILLSIFCFSLSLVYNVYLAIIPIICQMRSIPLVSPKHLAGQVHSVTTIIVTSYPLALLSFNVTEATKKAQLTGQLVHKLWFAEKEEKVINQLEKFSLQLIHEEVSFTAYGFFQLDLTLLQSIFATGLTYLVIIIQFAQSSNC